MNLFLALCILLPATALASEEGLPFIKWFSPQEYGGSTQVWSIAQDDRGVIYAGLDSGLAEYDGSSWRLIETPHSIVVRALAKGPDGRMYVGEMGDFGYLEPDSSGQMRFESLLDFVPKEDRDFQDVTHIRPTPEGIYVVTRSKLFRLTPDGRGWRTRVWRPAKYFRVTMYVAGTLFVGDPGGGLLRMRGDRLEPFSVPGLPVSPADALEFIVPYSEANASGATGGNSQEFLVGTLHGHLFVTDGVHFRPFAVASWPLLGSTDISADGCSVLSDGTIAIATRGAGLLLLGHDGHIRRYLDRAAGLPSAGVNAPFVDRDGALWLPLQTGIAKVEIPSPLTQFNEANGVSSAVSDVTRFHGTLYAATLGNGVLRLDAATGKFRTVPGTESWQVFAFGVYGDRLLVGAAFEGVFELEGDRFKPVLKATGNAYGLIFQSRQDANRFWLGTIGGLASMRRDVSGHWVDEGVIAKCAFIQFLIEPEPGLLWLSTQAGVVRVRLEGDSLQNPKVDRFGKADGLPSNEVTQVALVAGHVLFINAKGIWEFDSATERFRKSTVFADIPAGTSADPPALTDKTGNIWTNFGVRPILLERQRDGTYRATETLLRRLGDHRATGMFLDNDGVLWLVYEKPNCIIRYDPRITRRTSRFPTLLRQVTVGEKTKSVMYAGGGVSAGAKPPEVKYNDNAVRFEFSATSLDDPEKNQFGSMLEGFDPDWSAWSSETRRDYTNLPPGKYRFRVRSRNALQIEGAEADYRLKILPPWYRTWWAYTGYALLLGATLLAIGRLLRRRVIARERTAAEAKALQAELDRKRNVELLGEIGKELTSSLEIDSIFGKLYENVNKLVDAAIFGVGVYHADRHSIEYRLAFEDGKRYEPYTRDTLDKDQFPVWCVEHRKPVFINDVQVEYSRYLEKYEESGKKLEDGSVSRTPQSLIYLPLIAKDQVLGIITVQSLRKQAYTDYHLNLLQNLAAYASIAIDNADAYGRLKSAQERLLVQEKLASLGALTAGIAHEIKNPLNFVNNFADLSVELMQELVEELEKTRDTIDPDTYEEINALLQDLSQGAKKIHEHGKRADGIVRSMLLHSRGQAGEPQPTDINSMLKEYVDLAYHGMRAQDSSFNCTIHREFAADTGLVDAVQQDLSRVFLNILNNACYAVNEKAKQLRDGFVPALWVSTLHQAEFVEIRIRDNGMGIPPEVREKIFNPFFTTKPTGQGTGLGLSISHDIVVQEHGGQLEVETEPGKYTEFVVRLPRRWRKAA